MISLAPTADGAWHTANLQFCFDNTRRCEQGTGSTPEALALGKKLAAFWAAFAATGKPSVTRRRLAAKRLSLQPHHDL